MARAKNYETTSTFVKVIPRKLFHGFFFSGHGVVDRRLDLVELRSYLSPFVDQKCARLRHSVRDQAIVGL